jgi:hypothetical protein
MGLATYLEFLLDDVIREAGSLVFLVGVVLAAVVARPLGRRFGVSAWLAGLTLASLAAIAAVTLVPGSSVWDFLRHPLGGDLEPADCLDGGLRRAVTGLWSDLGGPLNIVLFVPAGLLLTLWSRRPVRVAVALSVLSLTIEATQVVIGRHCQAVDLVANSVGAVLGATAGALALAGSRRHRTDDVATGSRH